MVQGLNFKIQFNDGIPKSLTDFQGFQEVLYFTDS